jgi:hypothetical protein
MQPPRDAGKPGSPPDDDDAAERRRLEAAYRARFGAYPPIFFMSDALGIEVMRSALARNEPAPPEAWPQPGCNCA